MLLHDDVPLRGQGPEGRPRSLLRPVLLVVSLLGLAVWSGTGLGPHAAPAARAASHSSLSVSVQLTTEEVHWADQLFQNALITYVGEPRPYGGDRAAATMIGIVPGDSQPPVETLTVYYLARVSRQPVRLIWEQRRRGVSWVAIAQRYDVPDSYWGHWVVVDVGYHKPGKGHGHGHAKTVASRRFVAYSDDELERQAFIVFARDYYDASPDQVAVWLDDGFSYREVVLLLNYSRRARVQPATLVELRQDGLGWAVISRRYGVPITTAIIPVSPKIELNLNFEWHN